MNRKLIRLGTRGSKLALTQAHMVKEALIKTHPDLDVDIHVITTTGDKRTDVPLSQVAKVAGVFDKGVFLKELEVALDEGEIDIAVHSLKDMPSELSPQFCLAGVLPRAAIEDVLITKKPTLEGLKHIATGSVRRRRMGETYWGKGVLFSDIRGNVQTRLSKLIEHDDLDGIILARAGLDRLGIYAPVIDVEGVELFLHPLPVECFLPAAGQGIIGVETCCSNVEMRALLLGSINHQETLLCATAEREFLKLLGADCSTPVGVHASIKGDEMSLNVSLYLEDKEEAVNVSGKGSCGEPLTLASNVHLKIRGLI